MELRLSTLSYVVVDVETTGGSPAYGDRITEFAAVRVRDGRVCGMFETLVNPERPIPIAVTRLTHISTEMVENQPTFRELAPRIAEVIGGDVFVAHNAGFDWRFVSTELRRCAAPADLADTGGADVRGNGTAGMNAAPTMPARRLCTVRLARALLPHLRRRSLDAVAYHYGVPIVHRHRAGGDALATAHCLVRMLDELGTRGYDTWADMQSMLASSRKRPRRKSHRGWYAMPRGGEWELGA